MLSPEALRRKSAEAAERIERERVLAEERRKQEEEARRFEEDRLRREAEAKEKLKRVAEQTTSDLLNQAIVAASHGFRKLNIKFQVAEIPYVVDRLATWALDIRISRVPEGKLSLQGHLRVLALRLPQNEQFAQYVRLLNRIEFDLPIAQAIEKARRLLNDMENDEDLELSDSVKDYINDNIEPILIGEHLPLPARAEARVRWSPLDVKHAIINKLDQAPSWMLGASGQSLMQRLGETLRVDAEHGMKESRFELFVLPCDPERWGENKMLKLVHLGQPIGVSPFPPSVLKQVMEAIGFDVALEVKPNTTTLAVKW